MRVTYNWTQPEWSEAVTLATARRTRASGVSGMVYALVGIPIVGAALDALRALGTTQQLTLRGSVVPLLLLALFACLTAALLLSRWRRRQRMATQTPMPQGQWEAVLQEAGWCIQAKAVPPLTESAEPAADALTETLPAADVATAIPPAAEAMAEPGLADPEASNEPATADAPVEENKAPTSMEAVETATGIDESLVGNEAELPPPPVSKGLQPWSLLTEQRAGERVIVLLHGHGFVAVPIRCMSPDQASHLHRMVVRKLRPAPAR